MASNAESQVFRGVEGTGAAYLIRPDAETAVDYFARLQEAETKNKMDEQTAALNGIASIKPWAQDQPEFQKMRDDYINYVGKAMKGKWTKDPDYIIQRNKMREDMIAAASLSNEHKTIYDRAANLMAEHGELYPDDAHKELEQFRTSKYDQRPLEFRVKQFNDADFNKHFQSMTPPHIPAGQQVINLDGTGYTAFADTYNEVAGMELAKTYANDPTNKMVVGLKKSLMPDIVAMHPGFTSLPTEQQTLMLNDAAAQYINHIWKNKFSGRTNSVIDKQKTATYDDEFTRKGTTAESKNFIYRYEAITQDKGISKPRIYFGRNPKLGTENPPINIILENAVDESGASMSDVEAQQMVPKYWEQQDDGSWMGVGIVKGGTRRGKPMPDTVIKVPRKDIEGDVIVKYGNGLDKMIELTRPEIGSDKTGTAVGNTTAKGAAKPKTVKLSTLKSLIGTKGYEGQTLEDLKKYYSDNDYRVIM